MDKVIGFFYYAGHIISMDVMRQTNNIQKTFFEKTTQIWCLNEAVET